MKLLAIYINPHTQRLRSGWRALIFILIALLPRLAMETITKEAPSVSDTAVFAVDVSMVVSYIILIVWVALVSWFCLHFLEGLSFAALGYAPHRGWWRDLLFGFALSAGMVLFVVLLQSSAGGTQVQLNPQWEAGSAWRALLSSLSLTSLLLLVAAAFEEIVFRGYVFQTLLRGVPAVVPLLLLSLLFGLAHWSNPSRTLFSTVNTVLAGLWLAVAYLKTRSLWLPTGLHFGWNWMMGLFFGLPVSGLQLRDSIFVTSSGSPLWLTGGSYGCEGGLSATLAFTLSAMGIWRARWLQVSPAMVEANTPPYPAPITPLQLDLRDPS
jgi:uncharacterized protein